MLVGCSAKIDEYNLVSKSGFDYIELAGKVIAILNDDDFEKLKNTIKNGSLPCLALNAYCDSDIVIAGPKFDIKKAQKYASKLAARADLLGVKVVNIGSPKSRILPLDFDRDLAGEQIEQFYSVTADEFAKYGIIVTVEALGYCYCNFINQIDEALAIVKKINKSNLMFVLDYYNMQQSNEENADITPTLPYLAHVHTSDDAGSPQLRSFFRKNRYSVHETHLRKLKELGYNNTISIEVDVPFNVDDAKSSLELIKRAWL
ncbi:MAG: sugar phosphate isomerase/epimerase [Anaerolineaceae bacterium]|nr:MAG: sugar phosphate isomerase/epimerase [Anaerolineaceae bacterium]